MLAGLCLTVAVGIIALKPKELCELPGMEDRSVCQPDFSTATGLATLIPELDALESNRRSAALARLVGAFEPGSQVAGLEQRLLVQAILAYAHPDRVLSLGSDGQTNLIFVLSEIPREAWERPEWSGVRAAAQAAHSRLGNSFREGGWYFSTTRPADYEEFGRRIGNQPVLLDDMTGAGLARRIPDLNSPDLNVFGMAKKMLLGTFQTDVLPLAEKAVLTKAVMAAVVEAVTGDEINPYVVSLMEVLAAVPRQDWQEPSWKVVRSEAVSVYHLLAYTFGSYSSGNLTQDPGGLLGTLFSNLQILAPTRPITDISVRVTFSGYDRAEELNQVLANVSARGNWRFEGEPLRSDTGNGKSKVRYRGEGMEANAMTLARQLSREAGKFVSVTMSAEVPQLVLEVHFSE